MHMMDSSGTVVEADCTLILAQLSTVASAIVKAFSLVGNLKLNILY